MGMGARKKVRLGDLLVSQQLITDDQLRQALAEQKRSGRKLGRVLTDIGAISEHQLHTALARHLNIEYLDLGTLHLDPGTVNLLPETHARRYRAIVLQSDDRGVLVGMADPTDIFAFDELSRLLKKTLRLALVSETDLLRTLDVVYRRTAQIDSLAEELHEELTEGDVHLDQLKPSEDAADAPVIKLLQTIFRDAVQVKASDIHIEPDEGCLRIRQRVDGVLQEHVIEGRRIASALVTRLKLMCGLDISEKRMPQDGRFTVHLGDADIDVRVSTMPVQHGESVVMRLLDQSANLLSLEQLGMPAPMLSRFRRLIQRTAGMVLVTGPTGSGKTTTLYSALNEVNRASTKIITVEDPVEYRLQRINQVQVNPRIGLDFGRVLRTTLRQDPDVILIGEMRDTETVNIGLRAAMTGHLVFSTLHTISAVATVSRLLDMGAPGYLIAAALHGVVGQRLARRVCEHCTRPTELTPNQMAWLAAHVGADRVRTMRFVEGGGCNYCNLTGYRGRIGVYELLEMDPRLTDALRRGDQTAFAHLARQREGYRPLVHCALEYAAAGTTSLEEVMRVSSGIEEFSDTPAVESADPDTVTA